MIEEGQCKKYLGGNIEYKTKIIVKLNVYTHLHSFT